MTNSTQNTSQKNSKPNKNVLFILTGSIACYKACHVISRLAQAHINVQVVATKSALEFVGHATLEGLSGQKVHSDLTSSGNMMSHIHLIRNADLIIVAPATANFINKMSHGIADDLASTLFLAHDFKKPFLMAPAMNASMYNHPTTQDSIQKLKSYGVSILETESGLLACGEDGPGKLLNPDIILATIFKELNLTDEYHPQLEKSQSSELSHKNKKVLITAGGTQEKIDSVRALTNTSTGETGYSLAQYLTHVGFDVTLLLAENSTKLIEARGNDSITVKTFISYQDLQATLFSELQSENYDCVVHTAAVSDYSLAEIIPTGKDSSNAVHTAESGKISSDSDEIILRLKRNPKLIDQIKSISKNKQIKLIGFKLTANASNEVIYKKVAALFQNSMCDFVVHNDTKDIEKTNNKHFYSFYSKQDFSQDKKISYENSNQLNHKILTTILNEVSL